MTEKNNWEISILEIENDIGKKYKVTRRYPDLGVSETKIFKTRKDAEEQVKKWLVA